MSYPNFIAFLEKLHTRLPRSQRFEHPTIQSFIQSLSSLENTEKYHLFWQNNGLGLLSQKDVEKKLLDTLLGYYERNYLTHNSFNHILGRQFNPLQQTRSIFTSKYRRMRGLPLSNQSREVHTHEAESHYSHRSSELTKALAKIEPESSRIAEKVERSLAEHPISTTLLEDDLPVVTQQQDTLSQEQLDANKKIAVNFIWYGNLFVDEKTTALALEGPMSFAKSLSRHDHEIIFCCDPKYKAEVIEKINSIISESDDIEPGCIRVISSEDLLNDIEKKCLSDGFTPQVIITIKHLLTVFNGLKKYHLCKEILSPLMLFLYGGYYLDSTIEIIDKETKNIILPSFVRAMCPKVAIHRGTRNQENSLDCWMYYSPHTGNKIFKLLAQMIIEHLNLVSLYYKYLEIQDVVFSNENLPGSSDLVFDYFDVEIRTKIDMELEQYRNLLMLRVGCFYLPSGPVNLVTAALAFTFKTFDPYLFDNHMMRFYEQELAEDVDYIRIPDKPLIIDTLPYACSDQNNTDFPFKKKFHKSWLQNERCSREKFLKIISANMQTTISYVWYGSNPLEADLKKSLGSLMMMAIKASNNHQIIFCCESEFKEDVSSALGMVFESEGVAKDAVTVLSTEELFHRLKLHCPNHGFTPEVIMTINQMLVFFKDLKQYHVCKTILSALLVFYFGGYYIDTTVFQTISRDSKELLALPSFDYAMCPIKVCDQVGKDDVLANWLLYAPQPRNLVIKLWSQFAVEFLYVFKSYLQYVSKIDFEKGVYEYSVSIANMIFDYQDPAVIAYLTNAKDKISKISKMYEYCFTSPSGHMTLLEDIQRLAFGYFTPNYLKKYTSVASSAILPQVGYCNVVLKPMRTLTCSSECTTQATALVGFPSAKKAQHGTVYDVTLRLRKEFQHGWKPAVEIVKAMHVTSSVTRTASRAR